ncbi:7077_t:CDS:2, partial [Racocetra fulgida]
MVYNIALYNADLMKEKKTLQQKNDVSEFIFEAVHLRKGPDTETAEQEDNGDVEQIEQELYDSDFEIDDDVELYKKNDIEHKNVITVME